VRTAHAGRNQIRSQLVLWRGLFPLQLATSARTNTTATSESVPVLLSPLVHGETEDAAIKSPEEARYTEWPADELADRALRVVEQPMPRTGCESGHGVPTPGSG